MLIKSILSVVEELLVKVKNQSETTMGLSGNILQSYRCIYPMTHQSYVQKSTHQIRLPTSKMNCFCHNKS